MDIINISHLSGNDEIGVFNGTKDYSIDQFYQNARQRDSDDFHQSQLVFDILNIQLELLAEMVIIIS